MDHKLEKSISRQTGKEWSRNTKWKKNYTSNAMCIETNLWSHLRKHNDNRLPNRCMLHRFCTGQHNRQYLLRMSHHPNHPNRYKWNRPAYSNMIQHLRTVLTMSMDSLRIHSHLWVVVVVIFFVVLVGGIWILQQHIMCRCVVLVIFTFHLQLQTIDKQTIWYWIKRVKCGEQTWKIETH